MLGPSSPVSAYAKDVNRIYLFFVCAPGSDHILWVGGAANYPNTSMVPAISSLVDPEVHERFCEELGGHQLRISVPNESSLVG